MNTSKLHHDSGFVQAIESVDLIAFYIAWDVTLSDPSGASYSVRLYGREALANNMDTLVDALAHGCTLSIDQLVGVAA